MSGPISRVCAECGDLFVVTGEEQAHLARLSSDKGFPAAIPKRCYPCRQARRRARFEEPANAGARVERVCVSCNERFVFSGRDAIHYSSMGWVVPKRCRECRRRRQAERDQSAASDDQRG